MCDTVSDATQLRDYTKNNEEGRECVLAPEVISVNGVAKWATGFIFAVIFGWMAWLSIIVIQIDKNQAVMMGNRFKASDGLALQSQIIEASNPPRWLLDRIEDIAHDVEKHVDDRDIHNIHKLGEVTR